MAAAVDDLSGGRLILGLGAGWHAREHQQYGIPFYDFPTRYAMLQEALEVTTRLFRSETPVTLAGAHFPLNEAILLPRPQRKNGPPILIGGNGIKRTLPLAAQYADEWNGVYISPQGYKERCTALDTLLAERGRAPSDVKRSLMTELIFGKDDAELKRNLEKSPEPADKLLEWNRIVGTASSVADQIAAYAEAGVQRIMLMRQDQTDLETLERVARDVLPQFHS
jgi:alkanesulfonate monooxygenase SsuD/methylene tetrahydromethanopterin reductase-like flavin-dependent oxidoreductase (luciferase family)